MGLFRKSREEDLAETDEVDGDAVPGRERGPWDVGEVDGPGDRIDVGALWLPRREGMELRMEVDKASQLVTGASLQLHGSSLQVQVFAAPRSDGIWDDIRAEIAESVTKQGGTVDDLPGPFGRELLARLPVRTPEGRTGHRPVRFIGHDGPRWFLRGVLSGRAAVDPERAREARDALRRRRGRARRRAARPARPSSPAAAGRHARGPGGPGPVVRPAHPRA